MASDIDRVIRVSKKLESHLARRYNAQGRGLHEKVTSIERKLSKDAVRDLRYVATIRNKLLHDDSYTRIDERAEFRERARRATRAIGLSNTWKHAAVIGAVIVAAVVAAAGYLWLRLR